MDENPWIRTPLEQPYVLPEDRDAVEQFNRTRDEQHVHRLHIDKLLPEPFVGARDAPVVLLSNNPGLSATQERMQARQSVTFREWVRKNLCHESLEYPFYYLDPEFTKAGGGKWWDRNLKHLLKQFARKDVARSILNVVYFPYPSFRFGHRNLRLPSQDYCFDLIHEAVKRNAVIIHMRRDEMWLERVPELTHYKRRFQVLNTMTPVITPQCPGFPEATEAIAAFVKTQAATA